MDFLQGHPPPSLPYPSPSPFHSPPISDALSSNGSMKPKRLELASNHWCRLLPSSVVLLHHLLPPLRSLHSTSPTRPLLFAILLLPLFLPLSLPHLHAAATNPRRQRRCARSCLPRLARATGRALAQAAGHGAQNDCVLDWSRPAAGALADRGRPGRLRLAARRGGERGGSGLGGRIPGRVGERG